MSATRSGRGDPVAGGGRAAAALVKEEDAIARGMKNRRAPASQPRRGRHAGNDGLPSVTHPVDLVAVADGEMSVAMRLDRRVWFATRVHARTS
jgi:hypothetical protein